MLGDRSDTPGALGLGQWVWPLAVPRMSGVYQDDNTLGLMLAAGARGDPMGRNSSTEMADENNATEA